MTDTTTTPVAGAADARFGNLRRLHGRDPQSAALAREAARRAAEPEPTAPTLTVAAFQSSI